MPNDLEAAEHWLDSWAAGVSTQAGQAVTLARRVAGLTGRAESADGSIRVMVDAAGRLESLELDNRELARQIMAVLGRARSRLTDQVTDVVQETVGADSEAGRAVIHSFATRERPR